MPSVVPIHRARRGSTPVAEFTKSFRTIHGYQRAYVKIGSGPAILLIHGIGDSSEVWRESAIRLAEHYTVIAPDLLGHGDSDKPRADYSLSAFANAMRDLLVVLGIDRVTVVGHSLGGGIAMQFVYQYPTMCERVVLVCTGGVTHEVHPVLRALSAPASGAALSAMGLRTVRGLAKRSFRVLQAFDARLGRDARSVARVFDGFSDPAARHAFLRTLRSVIDWRGQRITMLDRCYLAAKLPVLIVWGEHDMMIPAEHARLLHEALPASRVFVFPGAGHFPQEEHPAGFAEIVDNFCHATQPNVHDAHAWRSRIASGEGTPFKNTDAVAELATATV